MDEVRLALWMDGRLPDNELTDAEVEWLAEAVFAAVAKKVGATKPSKELQ